MNEHRSHLCFTCTFVGPSEGLKRCLHPDAQEDGKVAGTPRSFGITMNATAQHHSFAFPERYNPLAIDDCTGYAPAKEKAVAK